MKKSSVNDQVRILHILEELSRIKGFSKSVDFEQFESDEKTQYACIRSLEIIGEASNYLTDEFQLKYKEVEWSQLIGLRNLLIHNYFGVDTKLLWEIIKSDLPNIAAEVEVIVEGFKS